MPETECFVCGKSLALFDEAAANFHLNACLDGGGETAEAAAQGDASVQVPNSNGIAFLDRPLLASCPVCNDELPQDDLEDHVEACLIAAQSPATNSGQARAASSNGAHTAFDASTDSCPCCLLDWTAIDVPSEDRELHVADCLSQAQALREDDEDDEEVVDGTERLSESRLQSVLSTFKANGFGKLRTAWKGSGQHTSVTPHLIPLLQSMLERSPSTRLAILCSSKVEHIKSQFGDFGWGCGYKSACMVFSALRHVEQYRSLLRKEGTGTTGLEKEEEGIKSKKRKALDEEDESEVAAIPSIEDLQHMAEAAWGAGFDPEGKLHFKGRLGGSRRWIGTSEVYTMFTWLGIRTTVIDFPKILGSSGAHTVLSKWVCDYFQAPDDVTNTPKDAFGKLMGSNGSSVRVCEDRMPLYLQHQGHSRVIVGVEQTKTGELNLLVFDCGKKVATPLKDAVQQTSNKKVKNFSGSSASTSNRIPELSPKLLEPYRVNLKSLSKKDEYQILRIETQNGPLTPQEKLARRVITSLRVTE